MSYKLYWNNWKNFECNKKKKKKIYVGIKIIKKAKIINKINNLRN